MPDLPTKDEIVERIQNDPIQRLRAEEVDGCFRPEREVWCEPGDCYCIRQCRSLANETIDALTVLDMLSELERRGVPLYRVDNNGEFIGWSFFVPEKPDE